MRPVGRIITYMSLTDRNSGSISTERLVSVDANSRRDGFLPAAPKFCGFGPKPTSTKRHELYHTSRQQKTPAENRQGPSTNPPTNNYSWGRFCASFMALRWRPNSFSRSNRRRSASFSALLSKVSGFSLRSFSTSASAALSTTLSIM